MRNVTSDLFLLADTQYADFQAKLAPTIERDKFIGVRVPALRKYAADIIKDGSSAEFIESLPHKYYDENLLHSVILERSKNFNQCIIDVESFLPYVDNWAVCDTLRPKVFQKHKDDLITYIKKWVSSTQTYTCRFGIDMLMTHYLDKEFKPEYLEYPLKIISSEYYVNMMIAWYYATALAKQWDDTIPYLEKQILPAWVHNKSIQKAVESRRITDVQKEYLKSLRSN